MGSRKCVYTGKDANCTDKVIPHDGGDIDHNWANSVPCSKEYKNRKGLNMPTEIEMELNRSFKHLELAKMDVAYWEKRIEMLRELNSTSEVEKSIKPTEKPKKEQKSVTLEPEKASKRQKAKKEKEIKTAYKEKEIQEVDLEKVVKKKKDKVMW